MESALKPGRLEFVMEFLKGIFHTFEITLFIIALITTKLLADHHVPLPSFITLWHLLEKDTAFHMLLLAMILDIIAGCALAHNQGRFKLAALTSGISKKIVGISAVCFSFTIQRLAPQVSITIPPFSPIGIGTGVSIVYLLYEGGSITSNAAKLGFKVPPFLSRILAVIDDNTTSAKQEIVRDSKAEQYATRVVDTAMKTGEIPYVDERCANCPSRLVGVEGKEGEFIVCAQHVERLRKHAVYEEEHRRKSAPVMDAVTEPTITKHEPIQ